jgi:CBS domain containing-hemolysin-like protein
MPPRRRYRESIREQTSQIGVRIMLAFLFVAAMGFAGKPYIMQEAIVVLLLLASLMAAILVLAIVFILFLEGISRAVLWKEKGSRISSRLEPSSLTSRESSEPCKTLIFTKPA